MTTHDTWYFAYGSNLLVEQKERRTGRIREARRCRLKDYRLAFNKQGASGEVYASIVPEPTDEVWGVVYRCDPGAITRMDQCEGVANGHYERLEVIVETESGDSMPAVTYIAGSGYVVPESQPSDEYLQRIMRGARQHKLDPRYVRSIEVRAGRRSCREYERLWRNFCVDKNLEGVWLERLNNLKAFRLISICEGHPCNASSALRSFPHVNLRMRVDAVGPIADGWRQVQPVIAESLAVRFSLKDEVVRAELRRRIRPDQFKKNSGDDFVVRIQSQGSRNELPQFELVRDWFERCVDSIEALDHDVLKIIASCKSR